MRLTNGLAASGDALLKSSQAQDGDVSAPSAAAAISPDPSVFDEIVRRCHGMLPPAVCKKVYEFARAGGLIVEVGTALGSATTALAMGLRDSGKAGRVVTFDPMSGGPLRQVRDPSDRADLVRENLEHFGVADRVTVVTDTLPKGIAALGSAEPISVLMMDADGRIDRDLLAVVSRLRKGTKLIVDDDDDQLRLTERRGSRLRVDQKMRLVHLLLARFKEDKLISQGVLIKDTYFGEVLQSRPQIRPEHVLEVYRELVFGYAHWHHSERARRSIVKWLERRAPDLLQRARVVYRNLYFKF